MRGIKLKLDLKTECEVDRIVLKWKAELYELEDQFLAGIDDRIFFLKAGQKVSVRWQTVFDSLRYPVCCLIRAVFNYSLLIYLSLNRRFYIHKKLHTLHSHARVMSFIKNADKILLIFSLINQTVLLQVAWINPSSRKK